MTLPFSKPFLLFFFFFCRFAISSFSDSETLRQRYNIVFADTAHYYCRRHYSGFIRRARYLLVVSNT
jgi:hypothetical protein